jgi:putative membrane protein
MKRFAFFAGILGVTLFGVLLAMSGVGDVARAVTSAGWATAAVVGLRAVALVAAGIAWHWLFPVAGRIAARVCVLLRFIREGINLLLPVGAIGGDVVGARLATFWRADGASAGASVIADVTIQALTQFVFALAGVAILVRLDGTSELVDYVLAGLAVAALLLGGFLVVQARHGLRLMTGILRRFGWDGVAQDLVDRLWRALSAVWARPGPVASASLIHLGTWFFGALEVYVVLHAIGYPISYAEAVVIESLGQAVRGAAFAVPGGIGVQEGGFIALCAIFAVPAGAALALSLIKRVADLALGLPGIVAWQVLEGRRAFAAGARP